eukprot:gene12300-14422_t
MSTSWFDLLTFGFFAAIVTHSVWDSSIDCSLGCNFGKAGNWLGNSASMKGDGAIINYGYDRPRQIITRTEDTDLKGLKISGNIDFIVKPSAKKPRLGQVSLDSASLFINGGKAVLYDSNVINATVIVNAGDFRIFDITIDSSSVFKAYKQSWIRIGTKGSKSNNEINTTMMVYEEAIFAANSDFPSLPVRLYAGIYMTSDAKCLLNNTILYGSSETSEMYIGNITMAPESANVDVRVWDSSIDCSLGCDFADTGNWLGNIVPATEDDSAIIFYDYNRQRQVITRKNSNLQSLNITGNIDFIVTPRDSLADIVGIGSVYLNGPTLYLSGSMACSQLNATNTTMLIYGDKVFLGVMNFRIDSSSVFKAYNQSMISLGFEGRSEVNEINTTIMIYDKAAIYSESDVPSSPIRLYDGIIAHNQLSPSQRALD